MANYTFEENLPTTQYTLIYPSFDHPESEYRKYLEHAQLCYEQFTGSYTKKKGEQNVPEVKPPVTDRNVQRPVVERA